MIAELEDGRKFGFPEDMPEDQVDRLVQALLAAEQTAKSAKADVKALQGKLDALAARPAAAKHDGSVVEEIRAMRADMRVLMERLIAAELADRKLVRDETGEPQISRAVT